MAKAASIRTRAGGAQPLVYLCECGKKWAGPPKTASASDGKRWKCECGRNLALRDYVIFQA